MMDEHSNFIQNICWRKILRPLFDLYDNGTGHGRQWLDAISILGDLADRLSIVWTDCKSIRPCPVLKK